MRQFTFSAASTDIANYQALKEIVHAERADQTPSVVALRVCAQSQDANGSAVIRFVLATKDRVLFKKDITATVSAVRTAWGGASGSYVCTLDEEFVDVAGAYQLGTIAAAEWYVGVATLTTINDLTVQLYPVRNN